MIGYVGSSTTIKFLFVVNYGLLIDLIDSKISCQSFLRLLKINLQLNLLYSFRNLCVFVWNAGIYFHSDTTALMGSGSDVRRWGRACGWYSSLSQRCQMQLWLRHKIGSMHCLKCQCLPGLNLIVASPHHENQTKTCDFRNIVEILISLAMFWLIGSIYKSLILS